LLGGQHSPAIFPRVLDRLEELLPETERIEVPNASHLLHEDDPTTYHRALRSFLASHGAD
jgi:pimeloyl-ACP methyl ester carboxylesterase